MANLIDFFSATFLRGLQLDAQLAAKAAGVPTFDEVRDSLIIDLNAAKQRAAEAGKRPADVDQAQFAVVAWLDETSARHSEWWLETQTHRPMQYLLYGILDAGNEFYKHLDLLSRQQDEVREVYYMALCLGFRGQFYDEVGEEGDLGKIRESLSRQLPQAPASLASLGEEHITPQPYSLSDPEPRLPKRSRAGLLRALAAAALLIPLLALVPIIIEQCSKREPPLRDRIQQIIALPPCAALTFDIDATSKLVTLKGRVENATDLASLQQNIASLTERPQVDVHGVTIVQWPFCEVMTLLDPYFEKDQAGLAVAPSQAHPTRYKANEDLILDIRAPTANAYVYVDYLQKDTHVVHLLPNPLQKDNALTQSSVITIGQGHSQPGTRFWSIQPPFGTEMIAVIAYPQPLFPDGRLELEDGKAYVDALRAALNQVPDRAALKAAYFFIETQP